MKRSSLFVIATALLIVIPTHSVAATKASVSKPKSAGRTSGSTPNTILSGISAPNSAIGINGDFYIDTKNANIYGPKSNGKWPTPTSLRGLSGINGLDGKNGSDAKSITNASTSIGPQGEKGEKGATGNIGATGAQGPAGSSGSGTGPVGPKGDTGLSGAAGISGTNGINGTNGSVGAQGATGPQGSTGFTGTTGNTGAAGSPGAKGDTGIAGADGTNGTPGLAGAKGETGTAGSVGNKGDAGATGSVGPSNSQAGTITFTSTLSGSAGTTKPSNNFGSFIGGKSYRVTVFIKTYNVPDNTVTFPISMTLNSAGSNAILNTYTYVSSGLEYLNPGECLFTTLVSELTIDGTGIIGVFNIQAVPIIGAVGFNIAMNGKYFSTEVGQVG